MNNLAKLLWQRLAVLINHHEKILLALLSVVIVISGTIWYQQASRSHNGLPSAGGTYVEGITGGEAEAELIASKITKAGLFTFDQQGNLQNLLVDNWTVNADKTEYHFHLLPDVSSSEITGALGQNIDIFGQAIVAADGQDLSIKLAQANADVPLLLTQPLFDYGPYKLSKLSSETTVLTRNTRAHAVSAYLNKIVIQNYGSVDELKTALAKDRVDGATLPDSTFSNSNYASVALNLPEYYVLMFNINRAPFRDQSYRAQVIQNNSAAQKPFTLTVENQEPYLTLANTLMAAWQKAGIPVTLSVQSQADIQNKIAPSRDFQAILTGVNYGYEYDPYYIWSSTQIRPPGNNLSGVKNDQVDSLITQIQAATNIATRQGLITTLHQTLQDQSVAVVLQQQTSTVLVSNNVGFVAPKSMIAPEDKWNAVAWWWQK